ncbi:MAG: tetratricopeptide repeat protein [Elusimicrobia bacterium]|nr:tetratricopeptide repeat protein [Elusimicrobiota bacterium]
MKNIHFLLFSLVIFFILSTHIQAQNRRSRGKCGDGICDEIEQRNNAVCPEDCGEDKNTSVGRFGSDSDFNETPPQNTNRNYSSRNKFDRNASRPKFSRHKQVKEDDFDNLKNVLEKFVKLEKKYRTTSKNIKTRWNNFLKTILSMHGPQHCVMLREKAEDISGEIDKNSLKNAAQKYNQMILKLDIKKIESCWISFSADSKNESNVTFEQLIKMEKTSPTTISNIRERWPMLIRFAIASGNPEKFLPPKEYLEKLPREVQLQEQVKIYKQAISSQNSQSYPTIIPQNYQVITSTSQQSFSTEIDKELATEFFYKAMQYYAKGELKKAKTALQRAHKLDPDNVEISKALERIEKDITMKSK